MSNDMTHTISHWLGATDLDLSEEDRRVWAEHMAIRPLGPLSAADLLRPRGSSTPADHMTRPPQEAP
jgi:hypothetical protein